MSKLCSGHVPSTISGIVIACTFSLATASLMDIEKNDQPKTRLYSDNYNVDIELANNIEPVLEEVITVFYHNFLATQESLSYELKKIIYDDLWNLYES